MERRTHRSIQELLQQDRYTPEEVSELLGIGLDVIRHAAFAGTLRANIEGQDIVPLEADDVMALDLGPQGPREGGVTDDVQTDPE